jgi:hypothetical protein
MGSVFVHTNALEYLFISCLLLQMLHNTWSLLRQGSNKLPTAKIKKGQAAISTTGGRLIIMLQVKYSYIGKNQPYLD